MKQRTEGVTDATDLLKQDHEKVKKLFKEFEGADDEMIKKEIAGQAIKELQIHSLIEEEFFYPALQQMGEVKELVLEANEEHHVAKILIKELEEMDAGNEHFDAKFMVLAEAVRHHIKEEESELLPFAKKHKIGADIAEKMKQRKEELESDPNRISQLVHV